MHRIKAQNALWPFAVVQMGSLPKLKHVDLVNNKINYIVTFPIARRVPKMHEKYHCFLSAF